MKSIFIFSLSLFFLAAGVVQAETFKVAPYVIKNHNNENILKFKPGISLKLLISSSQISLQGKTTVLTNVTKTYGAKETHEISLGKQECDHAFQYKVSSLDKAGKETVLHQNNLFPIPCDPDGELVIGFLADSQENKGHADLAKVILKHHETEKINFLIQGGDIVHFGALDKEWKNHFKIAKSYYNKLPVVAALGNHEFWISYLSRSSSALFKNYMRSEGDSSLTDLHLNFPQMDVIVMNSNFTWMTKDVYESHLKWLENALEKAKKSNKKAMVVLHHSPFTSGSGHEETEAKTLRRDVVPILEKAGNIPLVLSGHVHIYERIKKDKINYLVAGPAGGCKYKASSRNPFSQFIDEDARTFTILKIGKSKITVNTYDKRNALVDSYQIPL